MSDKLTQAQFSMQCPFIAKNASAWAGDILTLPERYSEPADQSAVSRFTDEMRERLDRLDKWAGRAAPPQTNLVGLIERIAATPIWRDTYPDGPDAMDGSFSLTPDDVRACRTQEHKSGWIKVTPDIPFEVLKSITIDNQVLAFERGRYFNAWLIFDEYEGGWCWKDEADSEPSPSHYLVVGRALSIKPLEWEDPTERTNGCHVARCIFGTYSAVNEQGWYVMLDDHAWGQGFEWSAPDMRMTFDDAAKAAQADYERRITSALQPLTAQPDLPALASSGSLDGEALDPQRADTTTSANHDSVDAGGHSSPAPQEQTKVAPLEWRTLDNGTAWSRLTLVGLSYHATPTGWMHRNGELHPSDDLEAAKAAAQADYEVRILSCLANTEGQPDA